MVPKQGGNAFHGLVFFTAANDSMQAENATDDLRRRGMTAHNHLKRIFDFNICAGGPVKRDKLRWFGMYRRWTTPAPATGYVSAVVEAVSEDHAVKTTTPRLGVAVMAVAGLLVAGVSGESRGSGDSKAGADTRHRRLARG